MASTATGEMFTQEQYEAMSESRTEALAKVKELAGKPRLSSTYYVFYMGDIRPAAPQSKETE